MKYVMVTPPTVKCTEDAEELVIPINNFECESHVLKHGDMGEEIEDSFNVQTECMKCQGEIILTISMYRYPANAYEYGPEVTEIKGCTMITMPTFTMDFSDDQ